MSGLRDSLCFKRLFIPGVCCPIDEDDEQGHFTTKKYELWMKYWSWILLIDKYYNFRPQSSLHLTPLPTTTTKRPPSVLLPVQTISRPPNNQVNPLLSGINDVNNNIVDESSCGQQEISTGNQSVCD